MRSIVIVLILAAMVFVTAINVSALVSVRAVQSTDASHLWPLWATDLQTLCEGLGLWGWVEPEPLPSGGTNTVRLVIRPADPADWPECD